MSSLPEATQHAARRRPLFFMHIPKTAGTSVGQMLWERVAPDRRAHVVFRKSDPLPAAAAEPDRNDLVWGHLPFAFMRRFADPPLILTFLRDPIERAISAFYFLRSVALHPA